MTEESKIEESLCPEATADGKHEWHKYDMPPEQCEGKTHVCVLCGAEKTDLEAAKSEVKVMELQTIDQAKERGEHTEEFHEAQQKAHREAITDEKLSRFLYEVKVAYRRMLGEEVQTTWESVSDEVKQELKGEIFFVRETLSAPHSEDRNFAMHIHDKTFASRLKAGYRYGPIIDHAAREHPDMVTFGMLPEKQRIKLYLGRVLIRLTAGIQAGY
jgi:hypothetical protein